MNEYTKFSNTGSKSVPCAICGKDVPRKKMSIHNAVEHNINPSLSGDSRKISGISINFKMC